MKTSRENNNNKKISSQGCSRNKVNDGVKKAKIKKLHYTSKHSLCKRFAEK